MTSNYASLRGSIDKVDKDDSYKIELINAKNAAEEAAKNAKISAGEAADAAKQSSENAAKSEQEKQEAKVAAQTAQELYNKIKQDLDEGKLRGEKGDVGPTGPQGVQGIQGVPGYTPQKGVDYWTTEEVDAVTTDAVGKAEEAANTIVSGLQQQLTETKATLTTTQDELKKAQRAIQFQYKLNKGQTWDFEEDSQTAYQRIVPSGAHAGAVMELSGKSRNGYQLLTDNFPVSSTQLNVTKNGRYSYALETVQEGAYMQSGTFQLKRGYAGRYTFHGNIAGPGGVIVRLLRENGEKINETTITSNRMSRIVDVAEDFFNIGIVFIGNETSNVAISTKTEISKIMLEAGDTTHPWEPYADSILSVQVDEVRVANAAGDSTATYPIPAAVKSLPGYGWSAGSVSNTVERTENGWQYVQRVGSRVYQDGDELTDGTTTYYALATPITTDITDLMGDSLAPFAVEAGGSITFHHPKADEGFAIDVPAKIKYITKLSEVSANG